MSWSKVKMGDFLINRDSRFKPKDKAIAGLKRIDKIDFSGTIYLSDKPSNTDMIIVKKGDLVISGINVEKGAMSVYQGKDDVIATIHYSSYSFDEKKIDIEFLKMFLKSPEFKTALKEQVPGGIKTEIKPKHLLPLEVNIPTLVTEQKEIVKRFIGIGKLSSIVDTEIINQQNLLIQLRQAFLREAMQGKLVMQDPKDGHARDLLEKIKDEKAKSGKKEKELPPIKPEEIPFGIPENWVWCRLGEISYIQTGIALGKKFAGKLYKYPYLRVANVQRGSVDLSTVKYLELPKEIAKKYYLKQFDILVNEGGDFDKVGRCAIWGASIQPCIHQNHIFAVRIDGVNQQYFEYAINSDSSRDYFLGTYKKSTNLASLNKTNLNLLPVPLPPLNEQNRIVEKLSELMNLCDDLQQSIQTSRDQNEYLLQQVLKEALKVNK